MPETTFKTTLPTGISIEMHYAREKDESGKLDFAFSSPKIMVSDGQPKRFSLSFNAIGDSSPDGFLESLDEGYLNDKISGLSVRTTDLFKTIEAVRCLADDPDYDLSVEDLQKVERAIEAVAIDFDGVHYVSSVSLVSALQRSEIPCFSDDPGHLIGHRRTAENILFHKEVWPEVMSGLGDFLSLNPDVDERLQQVREGMSPEEVEYENGPQF